MLAFALLAPSDALSVGAFLRLPMEIPAVAVVLLLLPARSRRAVAAVAGGAVGVLALVKALDLVSTSVRRRPFDLVLDWPLLGPALDYVGATSGRAVAVAAVVLLVVAALGVVGLSALAAARLTPGTRGLRVAAGTAVAGFLLAGSPVVATPALSVAVDHARQVGASLRDREVFAAEASADPFASGGSLSALRGRDVVVVFVESYGRVALEHPRVTAALDAGDRRLAAAGYSARSGYLTSPTTGGGSWLAHATLLSGLWVENQQRYDALVDSDRLTLPAAFRHSGWHTVGVMPGVTRDWPESAFFGYDRVYPADGMAYRGPPFGFASMPDQYALAFLERVRRSHGPLMAVVPVLSSHAPWNPVPSPSRGRPSATARCSTPCPTAPKPPRPSGPAHPPTSAPTTPARSSTASPRWCPIWRNTPPATWSSSPSATTNPRAPSPAPTPPATSPPPSSPATPPPSTGRRPGAGPRPAPRPRRDAHGRLPRPLPHRVPAPLTGAPAYSVGMTRALAVLTVGAFLTLVLGVVGSGEPVLSLVLGAVFAALAVFGFAWVRGRARGWAVAYVAVQLPLAFVVFAINAGVGATLFLVVLVSQCVQLLPRPFTALVVAVVPLVHVGMEWGEGLREGLGTLAAVVFAAVVTELLLREQRARRELADAHEQLRDYAAQAERLATAQERNRVARDIHDGLGHSLTVVQMQVKAARAVLPTDPAKADDVLAKAQHQAETALADVRRSVSALREPRKTPPLTDALRALADDASAAGLPTRLTVRGDERPSPTTPAKPSTGPPRKA
ncbi:histidine kinase [Actinokineospora soli]|uniref:Histidine kinase n=1 Tax=Actinokineospora soli TaxID=1048753 RepID=A0ABW2TRP9_9PSEU